MSSLSPIERLRAMRIAANNHPTTLPEATTKAIEDARGRGEYLQEVDCYWHPEEYQILVDLYKVANKEKVFDRISLRDYRKRPDSLNVSQLPEMEEKLKAMKEEYEKNMYGTSKEAQAIVKRYLDLRNHISAIQYWKPERRITVEIYYNDHNTDKVKKGIRGIKEHIPTIYKKLVNIVKLRKEAMTRMNEQRDNPMRNVHLEVNLNPLEFRVDASWIIHRSDKDWHYYTHFLHGSSYNLEGEEVAEYECKEKILSKEEKIEAERLKALAREKYEDYFVIDARETEQLACIDEIQDECYEEITSKAGHTYTRCKAQYYIVSDVDRENQTLKVIGYLAYKKDKEGNTIYERDFDMKKIEAEDNTLQFPEKHKRAKLSKMEKLLKPLTKRYDVSLLV